MSKKAILLTIGNEILSGDVIDDNSSWIAKKLFILGVELSYIFVIPDTKEIIKKFLNDYKDNNNKLAQDNDNLAELSKRYKNEYEEISRVKSDIAYKMKKNNDHVSDFID